MGRDLVEKDEGSGAGKFTDQPRLGEHETEQKGLRSPEEQPPAGAIVGAVNHY